jgi:hypothetical protein
LDALFSFSSEYIVIINKSYKRPSGNYSSSSSPSKLMRPSATEISGSVNIGSSSSNKGSISSIDEEIQLLMNSRSEFLFHYSFLLIHTVLSQIILYINTSSPTPTSSSSIYDDINDENSQSNSRYEALSRLKEVSNKLDEYDHVNDDNDDGSDNDNDDNNKDNDDTIYIYIYMFRCYYSMLTSLYHYLKLLSTR